MVKKHIVVTDEQGKFRLLELCEETNEYELKDITEAHDKWNATAYFMEKWDITI